MDAFNPIEPNWNAIDQIQVIADVEQVSAQCIVVPTSQGALSITVHTFGVRLRFGECRFGGGVENAYGMLVDNAWVEYPALDLSLSGGEGSSTIEAEEFTLRLSYSPLSFELRKGNKLVQ